MIVSFFSCICSPSCCFLCLTTLIVHSAHTNADYQKRENGSTGGLVLLLALVCIPRCASLGKDADQRSKNNVAENGYFTHCVSTYFMAWYDYPFCSWICLWQAKKQKRDHISSASFCVIDTLYSLRDIVNGKESEAREIACTSKSNKKSEND